MDPVTTFKVGKKEFVVIEREEFERLTRAEMDRIDAAIALKVKKQIESGKMKTYSLAEARKMWGD